MSLTSWLWVMVLSALAVLVLQRLVVRLVTKEARSDQLLSVGVPATATVLDSYDTGNRVASIFILTKLSLRVELGEGQDAFDTEITAPISPVKLAEFSPGRVIKIRLDPVTREVAVDQARR